MNKNKALFAAIALILVAALGACRGAPADDTPLPTETAMPLPTSTPAATPDPSQPITIVPPDQLGVCIASPLPQLSVRPEDETDYAKGASRETAELTIYEYSDFQCPGCAGMSPIVAAFIEDHPTVRLVYRHFPLGFHPNAKVTAEAAEAAGAQGKFWEMHDLLFSRASEWSGLSQDDARAKMSEYAAMLDLDLERFNREMDDNIYLLKVESHAMEAMELGLPGTPSFIFGNVLFPSDMGLSYGGLVAFKNILARQDELFYDEPPALALTEGASYQATLRTSKGTIVVNLLPEAAPTHVNNFIFLARERWYDGSEFFFVQDNFVAVTGDPTNSTVGYPGYYCQGEEQGVFDRPGLLGMLANGQFFITLGSDANQLSGQFALIGQVTEGLDVLQTLSRRFVNDPSAPAADVLEVVSITEQ